MRRAQHLQLVGGIRLPRARALTPSTDVIVAVTTAPTNTCGTRVTTISAPAAAAAVDRKAFTAPTPAATATTRVECCGSCARKAAAAATAVAVGKPI